MLLHPRRAKRTHQLFPSTTPFRSGYGVRTAFDSDSALEAIRQRRPSLALIDVWLQGSRLDGLGLVEAIKAFDPTLPIIVISGHGRSEEHTSELQSLMRNSYAVFCLKKKNNNKRKRH